MRFAALVGDRHRPRLEFTVPAEGDFAARLQTLAGLNVDESSGRCAATALTTRALEALAELGIIVDAFDFPETLASLQGPLVEATCDGRVRVFPRLAERADVAYELGDDATFDPELGVFEAPASAVVDWPEHLLPKGMRGHSANNDRGHHEHPPPELAPITRLIEDPQTVTDAVHNLAGSPGTDGYEREIELLTDAHGDVPDWFGMTPYPYQRIGALCVAAGRRLLADVPGLGKSVQAILASVLLDARRWIIVTPPVAQTNWAT